MKRVELLPLKVYLHTLKLTLWCSLFNDEIWLTVSVSAKINVLKEGKSDNEVHDNISMHDNSTIQDTIASKPHYELIYFIGLTL